MSRIVGITCGTLVAREDRVAKQALNRAYVRAVEQAGGIPIALPVTGDEELLHRCLEIVGGLLLTGGVDVAPAHYGRPPHPAEEVDPDRDAAELPLIREAVRRDMPIFAICRGIQALNVALGGSLYQDLPSEWPSEICHQQTQQGIARSAFSHAVTIEADSRLRSIAGADTIRTNSMHHQALRDVAAMLRVTAHAPDGVIEAAEAPDARYVVAVQFHPEETAPHDEVSRRLFEDFVAAL
jgi:putative glutamine amidotransferase